MCVTHAQEKQKSHTHEKSTDYNTFIQYHHFGFLHTHARKLIYEKNHTHTVILCHSLYIHCLMYQSTKYNTCIQYNHVVWQYCTYGA